MAPKRSAPPPPPQPSTAASSSETTGSDESEEEEEEIAHSPPPAAPKAPPPQKGQESETDDEDEDDEEEGEEEEDDKASHATRPAVPKNPPPPPPNREESETEEEEEEEETDDEAPQPKPAPKQAAEGKVAKPSSSSEDKKPAAPFQRTWSTDDEARILEALAAHRREHGALPPIDALVAALADSLDNRSCSRTELQHKVKNLKRRYDTGVKKGELPNKDHDRWLFDLSKNVWGAAAATATAKANGRAPREYAEMCQLYPYLAEEVKALEATHPGLFKRELAMIDDDKARALDVKIKKQRLVQMKLELRRYDLTKEVTRALMELVE